MEKTPFTREQELQILKALDEMDKDLGIDKLDDEAALNRIFSKYPTTLPTSIAQQSANWLDRLGLGWATRIGESLASPIYVYASFALILSLVSVTAFQAFQFNSQTNAADPLRGSEAVFQVVDDPEEAVKRLSASLQSLGVSYKFEVSPDGAFTLTFAATKETVALLPNGRVPLSKGTHYVVSFERSK